MRLRRASELAHPWTCRRRSRSTASSSAARFIWFAHDGGRQQCRIKCRGASMTCWHPIHWLICAQVGSWRRGKVGVMMGCIIRRSRRS